MTNLQPKSTLVLIIILSLTASIQSKSQVNFSSARKIIDSLENNLQHTTGVERIQLLSKISYSCRNSDHEKSIALAGKLMI